MTREFAAFLASREAAQVEIRPGVHLRVLGTTERVMLTEFFLERDAVVPPHQHAQDQTGYVVAGRVTLTIGGEARALEAGDSYAIPGGVEHGAEALRDTTLIEVFAPLREDFLG